MHAHIGGISGQVFNPYANAAALEKTQAQQEAAAARRKLLQAAAELGGDANADTVALVGQWKAEDGAVGDAGATGHGAGKRAAAEAAPVVEKTATAFYAGLGKPVADGADEMVAAGRISIRV